MKYQFTKSISDTLKDFIVKNLRGMNKLHRYYCESYKGNTVTVEIKSINIQENKTIIDVDVEEFQFSTDPKWVYPVNHQNQI